jgi:integrase
MRCFSVSDPVRRAKGAGSVTKLPDGRWLARFTVPKTAGRPAKRVSRITTSKRAAEDALREMKRDIAADPVEAVEQLLPRKTLLVSTYCESTWFPRLLAATELPPRARGALRVRTANDYIRTARTQLLGPQGIGHLRMSQVTGHDIASAVQRMTEAGASYDATRRIAQVARMLVKAAEKDGIVPFGTTARVDVPPQHPRDSQPRLSLEEVASVVEVMLADAALPEPPTAALCGLVMAMTGVRRGEACGIRWASLDLDGTPPTVRIEHSVTEASGRLVINPPKSVASRRVLPLPPELVEVMRSARRRTPFATWVGGPGGDAPQRPDAFTKYLRTVAERTGIAAASAAHAYRRSITDQLLDAGADVLLASRWLGHADGGKLVALRYAGAQEDRVLKAGELLAFPVADQAV